ncbi:MAG: extracellular solute-binding protein [Treponema sp.]|jgi:putative aldouronate transport system substrate-binding protein|nr:extracellular solute-binding protein [Treponema sp.]
MKKIHVGFFVVLLALTGLQVFAGGRQASTPKVTSDPGNPFGKYTPTLTVHFVRSTDDTIETNVLSQLPGQNIERNFWLDTYENELGIKVVYDWIVKGSDQYNQRINVSMASGELPDVLAVNATQAQQLINAGLVQDLTQAWREYAADFTVKTMHQEGDAPFLAGNKDGKMYGIPVTGGSVDSVNLMWLRNDWLDALRLPVPTTMNDLIDVMTKFAAADFDGNGRADTIGVAVAGKDNLLGGALSLTGIFNAYGAYPTIWVEKSGQLAYGGIQDECKAALTALNDMYKKGLIDKEFGVKDFSSAGEPTASGHAGVVFGQQWLSLTPLQSCKDNFPNSQWSAYQVPSATGRPASVSADLGTNSWLVVNKNFQYPEAVIKMVNLFIEKCWGATGDNGKYYAPPEAEGVWKLSPVTSQMPLKNIEAYLSLEQARKTGDTSGITGEAKSIYDKLATYYSGSREGFALWGWERIYGPAPSSYSQIDAMQASGRILINKFVGAPTETMTERFSVLEARRNEVFTKIIMGDSPIGDFDRWVVDFNNLGGSQITKEVNEWYASVK